MDKLKMHSPNLTEANIAKLAELFPSCVTEARDEQGRVKQAIDFDQLRQELSENIVEGPQERFRLDWPGKREALLAANAPIAKTLRAYREESVDFDSTRNIFIEGDNLDALKLIQEAYLEKVKVIYIDPPYNTGGDFIYKDTFQSMKRSFERDTFQYDDQLGRMVANPETEGRYHSNWLSMMYSRIRVAKNLLRKDGVIFISISDIEVSNLRKICDEIFGEGNFVTHFTWIKKRKGSHLSRVYRSMTEFVLCYARDIDKVELFGERAYSEKWQPLAKRTNSSKHLFFQGGVVETTLEDGYYPSGEYGKGTSSIFFENGIKVESGVVSNDFSVKGPFVWTQVKLNSEIGLGSRVSLSKKFGFNSLRHDQADKVKRPSTLIDKSCGVGTNEDAYEEALELFSNEGVMSYPKPESLIRYLVRTATENDKDSIVLDFFAGSSTTAHAVMKLNSLDAGRRQFIMIQLPEPVEETSTAWQLGYGNIAEISKERVRRCGRIIKGEESGIDLGFRVLKVDSSNMRDIHYSPEALSQDLLSENIDNIREGRSSEDLLFQVLLDWGVDLSLPISRQELDGKTIFFVDGAEKHMALAACFDLDIDEGFVKQLAEYEPLRVVFRDAGFASDSVKINVEQIFAQKSPNTDVKVI
ncbi:site-specific DNA-methyltransferase [Alloalcanivorax profundimaris]|uniref:site-specific DNA-methyltransferase n=1 Tax=Alloalcanivorax profundimaris TaxID=2735259 RepID=UPI00188934FA|nr:site-specific DNA-methyltransferase [Alloalcanivorax profundimaris]MBF1801993.1 site-specific DNA-methyltransferase [Alloalcanivorax profundimaris]